METFSRRAGLESEYSGPGEVSPRLRARLRAIVERYLADEHHLGVGSDGLFVHTGEFHHRLSVIFGTPVTPNQVLLVIEKAQWNVALDTVEIYLEFAERYAYKRDIPGEIGDAFSLSGSVYYLDNQRKVRLRIDEGTSEKIAQASEALGSSAKRAQEVFNDAVGGLLGRTRRSPDVVKDVHVALEEYLKQITGAKDFDEAVKVLRGKGAVNRAQAQLLGRLYGYRSEGFGTAHAGDQPPPSDADALWYVETVAVQVTAIDRVVKNRKIPLKQDNIE